MGTRIPARRDLTLAAKRFLMTSLYRGAKTRPAGWALSRMLAPSNPPLALALGEALVSTPRRVLALTAHPDDLEFFAGGTLRRLAQQGSQIAAVVLTDGEKRGNWVDLAGQRQAEQLRAAALQGYDSVRFLSLPDFGLPEDPRLERAVTRAWDWVAPEVVLAFDPKELLPQIASRDHKALGRAVLDLARARFETGVQVYFYGTHHPDTLVDITPVIEEKVAAVKAHRSQMVYLNDRDTSGAVRLMGRVMAGRAPCRFAEGLYRLM